MAVRKPDPKAYELIDRDDQQQLYVMLDEILAAYHQDIHEADVRIVLAWANTWKPDVDGKLVLGRCKRASDLDRELAPWDFVILLNRQFFEDADVTEAQRRALLDHELSHAAVKLDADLEPIEKHGRKVFRIRKHDLEEFEAVVARHGCYKRDIERFAEALAKKRCVPDLPLLKAIRDMAPKAGSGADSVTISDSRGNSVELTPATRAKLDATLKARRAGAREAGAAVEH